MIKYTCIIVEICNKYIFVPGSFLSCGNKTKRTQLAYARWVESAIFNVVPSFNNFNTRWYKQNKYFIPRLLTAAMSLSKVTLAIESTTHRVGSYFIQFHYSLKETQRSLVPRVEGTRKGRQRQHWSGPGPGGSCCSAAAWPCTAATAANCSKVQLHF